MKLADTALLATAKLKLRKRRLVVSAATIGVLFGVVIALLVISSSFIRSFDRVSGELFNGDTYVVATESIADYNNPSVFARAKELYDASTERNKQYPLLTKDQYGTPTDPTLDRTNTFAQEAMAEFRDQAALKAEANTKSKSNKHGGEVVSRIDELTVKDGTVAIDALRDISGTPGSRLTVLPASVLRSIVVHEPKKDVVPVIIYASYAERIMSLPPLAKNASADERTDRLQYVYAHAPGVTFNGGLLRESDADTDQITYQIIGIIPDNSTAGASTGNGTDVLDAVMSSIKNNSLYDMIIPDSFVNSTVRLYYQQNTMPLFNTVDFLVKFTNLEDVSMFNEKNNCSNPANGCNDFYVTEFITSRIALKNFTNILNTFVVWTALFFTVVAVFIMVGVLSRIIDDERQATAIYRAVGASKPNIRNIYLFYTMIICLATVIVSLLVGYVMAISVHLAYAEKLTQSARELAGVTSLTHGVWLAGFDIRILIVVVTIFVVGVLAILLTYDKVFTKNIAIDIKE